LPEYAYFAKVNEEWMLVNDLLAKATKKQLRNAVFISLLVWAVTLLLYFALNRHDPWGNTVFLIFVLIAIALVSTAVWHSQSSKSELLQFLEQHPKDVVWVYYHKMEHLPFGLRISAPCTLIVGDKEKGLHRIQLPEENIVEIMNALRQYLPFAVFGFSRYKEQLYRSSPSLLSKEKHDEEHEA